MFKNKIDLKLPISNENLRVLTTPLVRRTINQRRVFNCCSGSLATLIFLDQKHTTKTKAAFFIPQLLFLFHCENI